MRSQNAELKAVYNNNFFRTTRFNSYVIWQRNYE